MDNNASDENQDHNRGEGVNKLGGVDIVVANLNVMVHSHGPGGLFILL
jgi:hypothetical protein